MSVPEVEFKPQQGYISDPTNALHSVQDEAVINQIKSGTKIEQEKHTG